MSRKEFEKKIKRQSIIEKKEASNMHWDSVYKYELRKKEQEENEKKYAIIIKFVLDEISKRPPEILSKRDTALVIESILAKSKYVAKRFKR